MGLFDVPSSKDKPYRVRLQARIYLEYLKIFRNRKSLFCFDLLHLSLLAMARTRALGQRVILLYWISMVSLRERLVFPLFEILNMTPGFQALSVLKHVTKKPKMGPSQVKKSNLKDEMR